MSFQKPLFQIGLSLLLFLSGFLFTFAEDPPETEPATASETEPASETDADVDYACATALIEDSDAVLTDYFSFLDEYMRVDVPSSQQVEYAMMYYRFVEDSLNDLYDTHSNIGARSSSLAFATEELAVCRQKRDEYLLLARTALYKQVLGSATSKTTFKFVDGLKVMNEHLSDLSAVFHQSFPGQFLQMDNGLQCYASQCVGQ